MRFWLLMQSFLFPGVPAQLAPMSSEPAGICPAFGDVQEAMQSDNTTKL
jgi:hypothetical protein